MVRPESHINELTHTEKKLKREERGTMKKKKSYIFSLLKERVSNRGGGGMHLC